MNNTRGSRVIYDIVRLIDLHDVDSPGLCVLLRPNSDAESFLADLAEEVRVQLRTNIRVIESVATDLLNLLALLQNPPDDLVLVTGLEQWDDESLVYLDLNRSALERTGFLILWLPLRGITRLLHNAPNLRSWIGGSIFGIDPDRGLMTEQERQVRLSELSRHYRLEGKEVIRMAETGTLPPDPEYLEWLILLGRADLAR